MLKQVAYTTLFVSDQEQALDFYVNTLGFETVSYTHLTLPTICSV